jgi:diguanylate cyclase (GGDEF)-like protein/PAS domain S-box-containing protein
LSTVSRARRLTAENAVRRSEQRLNEAQLLAGVGSWEWDVANDRVTWSPGLFRIYRLDPADFDPSYGGFLSRVHPEDKARVADEIARSLDHKRAFEFDYRASLPDGSVARLHTIGHVETDAEGRAIYMVGSCQDVTAQREAEAQLRASEERYRSLVELSPDAIVVAIDGGTIRYANPAAAHLVGAPSPADLEGVRIIDLVHPDSVDDVAQRIKELTDSGEPVRTETGLVHADGHRVTVEVTSSLVTWRGRPAAQVIARDVSVRKEAELFVDGYTRVLELVTQGALLSETLGAITALVESLSPGSRCSVMVTDNGVLRMAAAPSLPPELAAAIDGIPVAEGAGCCGTAAHRLEPVVVDDAIADPLLTDFRALVERFGVKSCWSFPVVDSATQEVLATFAVYNDEARGPTEDESRLLDRVTHLAEIAIARKRGEDELAHQALHDLLTGLPNRALLLDRLEQALARARRNEAMVVVLFLDLDHFKVLNDSRGHAAGDELLQAAAGRLRDVIRPSDTVARFGGDEFVVVCEGITGEAEARLMGERITKAVEAPFPLAGGEAFIGVSVGIVLASGGEDADTALSNADAAMYRAKERGRGRVEVFDEKLRIRSRVRYETESALRRAVDRGELTLVYQPVVSVADGRMAGAEALVRWTHPEKGEMSPDEFIPLAEDAGLIMAIGAWVLEEACAQTARWMADHPEAAGFSISVNLSARQLLLPNLVDEVVDVLRRTVLPANRLTLEITETVLMEDVDFSIERLLGLKELGVRLAVDDFGTGYSSLSYLKQLPIDTLKVDRTFVDGLGTDAHDSSIVAAVVALAEALGLTALAEGVETRLHVAELRSLGCKFAQGFHYSRPVPAEELALLFGRVLPDRP